MIKNVSAFAIFAAAAVALPGIAQAGSASDVGSAVFTVINKCEVDGTDVHLGTFTASQTWDQVGAELGLYDGTKFTAGSQGLSYLSFGSVTCDKDTNYKLTIKGSGTGGTIKISHNGKVAAFLPAVKKLAGVDVADSTPAYVGTGAQVWTSALAGVGTGALQELQGNVMRWSRLLGQFGG